ncbi:hypothetical protein [Desulfomonile tiedjei]|nr:hypothetical protein [Desulfomonile tiedjei]
MNDETTATIEKQDEAIDLHQVLEDLRGGLRTKGFLYKYGLTLHQFEELLKMLIRKGMFSKEEFKQWKSHKPAVAELPRPEIHQTEPRPLVQPVGKPINVATFVITDPEKNNSWALQLFSIKREEMRGAKFKVALHGKKYAFEVHRLLFRGSVEMLPDPTQKQGAEKTKREEAIEFIANHGWSAYLERRALAANLGTSISHGTGRLALLHCKNDTFLAALHTPTPAINLYVGNSVDKIMQRLSKSIKISGINI